jgi:hypothetical protein
MTAALAEAVAPCPRCGAEAGPAPPGYSRPIRCDSRVYGGPEGTCKTCHSSYAKAHAAGRPLGPTRPGTSARVALIAVLAAEGLPIAEIAGRVGLCAATVYKYAAGAGISVRSCGRGRAPAAPPPDPLAEPRRAADRYLLARSSAVRAGPAEHPAAEAGRRAAEDDLEVALCRHGLRAGLLHAGYLLGLDAADEVWVRPMRPGKGRAV